MLKKTAVFLILGLYQSLLFAQNKGVEREVVEMADAMRASGLIYVVVMVIAIVFVGIAAYLFAIDRKIGRLEKEFEQFEDNK